MDDDINLEDSWSYDGGGLSSVGPNNNGTYNVPSSAQTYNTPWDAAGGGLGQYGNDVFQVLQQGIGVYSQYKKNQQFLDYQRYEATQGGVYQQGRPNPTTGAVVQARATGNPLMLILLVGGVILLLRK